MEWFIPAMFALVLWAFGQIFIKRGLSDISPFMNNLIVVFFILLVEIPFALIGGVNWRFFPFILLIGFFAQVTNFVFLYVIQKAHVSLSGTVLAIYPIFTIALSLLFLQESLTILQVVGIAGILLGTFFVAKPDNEKFTFAPWVIWALVGAVLIGTGDFIGKVGIHISDLYSFIFAFALGSIPGILFTRLIDHSPIQITGNRKSLMFSIIGNFLMPMGLLFVYLAFNKGPASLISPIVGSYPALTAILALY